MGLHLVLWLHQYAGVWRPLVTVALLGGPGWLAVRVRANLQDRDDWRATVRRWWREFGGPGMVAGAGMLLLVSPGWSWPDALVLRMNSVFLDVAGPVAPGVVDGGIVPAGLPAWEDMMAEGVALAEMMKHTGELTLLWSGLELAVLAVLYAVLVAPDTSRRQRWLFHRPSAVWRVLHGDVPSGVMGGLWLVLVPGLGVSEWLRDGVPAWPGTVLQVVFLVTGTALLASMTRHADIRWGGRVLLVIPASLMVLRVIWILMV
ncbi:hypothetical protein [Enterobacter ludwigii]